MITEIVRHWGYLGIFLGVLLGNAGLPVPEETLLIVAGYFVWRQELRPVPLLLIGIVSAVVGDNAGFWLGRRYGRRHVERCARWALVQPDRQEALWRGVRRYGAFAVFAGRFLPGLRFLAGPLAGAAGLEFRRFFVANLLGAALFVPYAVGLGYAIGYGLGVTGVRRVEAVVPIGVALLALAGLGARAWRVVRARRKR